MFLNLSFIYFIFLSPIVLIIFLFDLDFHLTKVKRVDYMTFSLYLFKLKTYFFIIK